MKRHLKRILISFFGVVLILAFIGFTIYKHGGMLINKYTIVKKSQDETIQAQAAEIIKEDQEEPISDDIVEPDPEEYATSHMNESDDDMTVIQGQMPLTTSSIEPSDVYAEEDSIVIYKCYYPEAVRYTWEIYNAQSEEWAVAPNEDVLERTDELYRPISTYITTASEEHTDLLVRCRIDQGSGEFVTNAAALHILPKISSISVEEYTSGAGTYVSTKDIPVTVTYQDGRQETVTGLNGLYFLSKEESSEQATTVSGNMMETITTVITACDYCYLDGETESTLRYQGDEDPIDIPIKLIGLDITAPVIEGLHISDFEISTIDQAVPVVVTITAEDNVTAYTDLEYAFLPEGEEPQEDSWTKQASFNIDITQNGIWIAYCRDKSGNIATEETDIIAVDNKAPIVSLSLENDTWCTENKIIVDARDGLSVEYRYRCMETGEDTGWTAKYEHIIRANSTWKVEVRDAVGNVTEQEIVIDNIDTHAPVIRGIREKQKERQ